MTSSRPRRRASLVLATAAALVVTACTAEKKDDASGTTASGGAAAPPAAKIAPGVTDDAIKIGVVYPDLSAVKHVLNIDHGDYEATFDALIKKVNDAGGIQGRKIQPVYAAINVASPAAAQETCVKLTQDEKVFAVIGSLNTNEPLCYVQTHKTAVVGGSLNSKNYALAQAPWFSTERGGDELADAITLFNAALTGRKVAVAGVVSEQSLVQDVVLPALKKLGVTPVETAILDANPRDAAATAQQTGVFIQKFQAAGADTVVVVGGMASSFPKELEKTGYRPQLLFTSRSNANAYTSDSAKRDFSTVTNALALGPADQWSEATGQECVNTVEAAIPDLKGKLSVDPETVPAGQPTPQVSLTIACNSINLFKAIADKAGKDLTYESFQNAGFSLGSFTVPFKADKANFTREAPHGAVPSRLFKYDPATGKFAPVAS